MSQEDPFGVPLNPPGFQPLASGDESVLAASGLNSRPPGPRNKAALVALSLAVLVGGIGIAVAEGVFRAKHKPAAVAVQPAPPASPSAAAPTPAPSPRVKPKPKPVAPKALAGAAQPINKANSGTLGQAYTVTVPTGWTVTLGIRGDRVVNGDLRLRNADGTVSLTIATIKPAVATGRLTPAKIAAIKAALLTADPAAKSLPGTPRAQVAGAAATGYDARTTSQGTLITIRTIAWQHGAAIYAATWRVPTASFAKSLTTFTALLAAVKFAA